MNPRRLLVVVLAIIVMLFSVPQFAGAQSLIIDTFGDYGNAPPYNLNLNTLHSSFAGTAFGNCPAAEWSPDFYNANWQSTLACYDGVSATAIHLLSYYQGMDGPPVLEFIRDHHGLYIVQIAVYANNSDTNVQHIHLFLDNGRSIDGPSQSNGPITVDVNEFVSTINLAVISTTANEKVKITRLDVMYTSSIPSSNTPRPTNTTVPTVQQITATPQPTRTLEPSPTLGPSVTYHPSETVHPSATQLPSPTPTKINTRVAPVYPTFENIDTCNPLQLATPCAKAAIFPVPRLPTLDLPSPTLRSMVATPTGQAATWTPSPTLAFAASPTLPAPTVTLTDLPNFDTGPVQTFAAMVNQGVSTLAPLSSVQLSANGTPTGADSMLADLGSRIGGGIAFIKGLELTDLNRAGGVFSLFLLILAITVIVEVIAVTFPAIKWLVNLIISVIKLIPFA